MKTITFKEFLHINIYIDKEKVYMTNVFVGSFYLVYEDK